MSIFYAIVNACFLCGVRYANCIFYIQSCCRMQLNLDNSTLKLFVCCHRSFFFLFFCLIKYTLMWLCENWLKIWVNILKQDLKGNKALLWMWRKYFIVTYYLKNKSTILFRFEVTNEYNLVIKKFNQYFYRLPWIHQWNYSISKL